MMKDFKTRHFVQKEKPFASVLAGFSEAFVTGKFCDVKVICKDTNLWAHRLVLGSVSPFLHKLLVEFERRGDDVITIFLPLIKGYHMKLVLDYIYSGAMYLCGAHMQYVIQVMEVLQLKCGVSVNKMVYSGGTEKGQDDWIEIEHSTMTIKTDHKEENMEEDDSIGHNGSAVNGDCSVVNDIIGASAVNKRKNSTAKIKSNRKKKKKVFLQHPDENKISLMVDHERMRKESEDLIKLGTRESVVNTTETLSKPMESVEKQGVEVEKDIVINEQKIMEITESSKTSLADEFSEDENDVVMVELDEEFVVEQLSGSGTEADHGNNHDVVCQAEVIGEQAAPNHRCVLCGRTFRHYMNLQVHLTGHLGVKVNINRCAACKRNFRNKRELDLHTRSHKFARLLGKFRTKATKNRMVKTPKIITTTGSQDKKIIRKYVKKVDIGIIMKPVEKIDKTPKLKRVDNLTCALCDKSFGVKSLFLRHIQKVHPDLAETLENHTMLQTMPSIKIKKVMVPEISDSPKPLRTPTSPKKFLDSDNPNPGRHGTPNRTFVTPLSKGKEMLKTAVKSSKKKDTPKTDSEAPELPDYYNTLECPDCDRVFIAKSIFERHLQSAKHGIYSMYSSESDHFQSPPSSTAEFWAAADKQKALVDPDSPRKIECHLCGQNFVRVRDLAKHREKMCQAYHSGKSQV